MATDSSPARLGRGCEALTVLARNPGLSHAAFRLHVAGLLHTNQGRRFIHANTIPRLITGYQPRHLLELLQAGLWTQTHDEYEVTAP